MAMLPDYDALERWQHSIAGESYTEHQKRMERMNLSLDDPDWDLKAGYADIDEVRRRYSNNDRDNRNERRSVLDMFRRDRKDNRGDRRNDRHDDRDYNSNLSEIFEDCEIHYRETVNGSIRTRKNLVMIECTFGQGITLSGKNVVVMGSYRNTSPDHIKAQNEVAIFGHDFDLEAKGRKLVLVGYDCNVERRCADEEVISSRNNWRDAADLYDAYAEELEILLNEYHITSIRVPSNNILSAPRNSRQRGGINVNGRNYRGGNEDLGDRIVNALVRFLGGGQNGNGNGPAVNPPAGGNGGNNGGQNP